MPHISANPGRGATTGLIYERERERERERENYDSEQGEVKPVEDERT